MQGKTLYTILLSIIAVLTLALAVLVIFLFTTINANKAVPEDTSKTQGTDSVVPLEEQAEFNLYASEEGSKKDPVFNIKSTENHPSGFLMASISIIYDAGAENELLEIRNALLVKNLSQLKEATIEYFRGKTYDELQAPASMQEARESLKEIYGKIINEDPDESIILKIVLTNWIIQ